MKTTSILSTFVAIIGMTTSSVSAACFRSGEAWSSVNVALDNAQEACNTVLSGDYEPLQRKDACSPFGSQRHEFSIISTNRNSQVALSSATCFALLSREIQGCSRGGRRTDGDFEVTADPNAGTTC
ncbi:hypothetical protein V8F20_009046 [Naviculisporaceae sp. PSN 640]